MRVEVECSLLVGDRLVVVCVCGFISRKTKRDQKSVVCGAVKFGRVKMALAEVEV